MPKSFSSRLCKPSKFPFLVIHQIYPKVEFSFWVRPLQKHFWDTYVSHQNFPFLEGHMTCLHQQHSLFSVTWLVYVSHQNFLLWQFFSPCVITAYVRHHFIFPLFLHLAGIIKIISEFLANSQGYLEYIYFNLKFAVFIAYFWQFPELWEFFLFFSEFSSQ